VLGKPEYGHTLTRTDGEFDLAFNGGGSLVVEYRKDGYLPAQRRISIGWRDWGYVDDVVLVLLDQKATTIVLGPSAPLQIGAGSLVEDEDGARQATVIFPAGVMA
jgi:hypothetical protein